MGPFTVAWLLGNGIIVWRTATAQHLPPSPRALLAASGLFAGLAALATYQPARGLATALAYGVDLAVLLQVLPGTKPAAKGTEGWSAFGVAGNTVIIPDGTAASSQVASDNSTGASSAGTSTAGAGSGGSASANEQVAQQVIGANSQYSGWGSGKSWACLQQLWTDESGWSSSATNASSGAYGIAQSLHGNKGGQGGNEYNASDSEGLTTAQLAGANAGNAADQIAWGLAYIAATYGDPCAALQHENQAGWY